MSAAATRLPNLRPRWNAGSLCNERHTARDDFIRRVQAVAALAESAEVDILLVSHAGMMSY